MIYIEVIGSRYNHGSLNMRADSNGNKSHVVISKICI